MKILYVSRKFYPDISGGGQISAFYIAKALKDSGNQVSVLTFTDGPSFQENREGIYIFREHIKKLKHFPTLSNLEYMYWQIAKTAIKMVKKIKPDVVHLLNGESIPFTSFILKKKFKIPIFATANGPWFGCFTSTGRDYKGESCAKCEVPKRFFCCASKWGLFRSIFYYPYSLWYMKELDFSFSFIDKFFPVSEGIAKLLKNAGISKSKMAVIHNPIMLQKKLKTNVKKKLGIEDKKAILYAGRLSEDKGVQDIIQAVALLPQTALVIVGKGPHEQKLKRLAGELNLAGRVKFIGFVSHEKLGRYYSIAELVVLPGTYYEPLSRMLLEACSYGIPVIASDVGGNSEVVENGKNGVLLKSIEPHKIAQAIEHILSNKQVYARMGRYAKQKMKNEFSPGSVAKKLSEQYKNEMQRCAFA